MPCALLVLSHSVFSQQPPTAGSQLQQIPPSPAAPRAAPEIRIEPFAAPTPSGADQARIAVDTLRLSGISVYSEAELLAHSGFEPGREWTLTELQALAARIADHYRSHGHFVAQAFVPAQEIKDRTVTIAVSEGRYGEIALRNDSRLADRVARRALVGLSPGDLITTPALESGLLLLSDLPGVQATSTLVPGTTAGTSDLRVALTPGPTLTGSVDADNAGNRYTGANRIGATVHLNNPLGLGDVASVRALTSGSGLQYGRVAYQVPFGRAQVGVAYSLLDYRLDREFRSLQAHGRAHVATVFGRYAVLRSRSSNLNVQLALDAKRFDDRVDSVPSRTEKASKVLTASLYGDHRDRLGGGGLTAYSLAASVGRLDIQTPAARAADTAAARSDGGFGKLAFSAMRLQSLGGPYSLVASASGQVASKNLDISEKMELGGMNGVRAYPQGEAYADHGVVLSLEGRMNLPGHAAVPGQLQLVAFVDAGRATLNDAPWAPGTNRRTLAGAGIGMNWSAPGNFQVRTAYAHRLGGAATSAPDRSGRFWVQLVKYF